MRLPRIAVSLSFTVATAASAQSMAGERSLPAFSANAITITARTAPLRSRVYFSGKRVRSETDAGGSRSATLMDLESKRMWLLMPGAMGCLEQPVPDDPRNPLLRLPNRRETAIGAETLGGHVCDKCRVETRNGDRLSVLYEWRARDLGGLTIRTRSEDGNFEMRFENIKRGRPDRKLFETPKDCRPAPGSFG